MKPVMVRRIARADGETIRLLGELGVATVHEAQGRRGLMRPYMRPIYPSARLSRARLPWKWPAWAANAAPRKSARAPG
jgi:hypothetical protein